MTLLRQMFFTVHVCSCKVYMGAVKYCLSVIVCCTQREMGWAMGVSPNSQSASSWLD